VTATFRLNHAIRIFSLAVDLFRRAQARPNPLPGARKRALTPTIPLFRKLQVKEESAFFADFFRAPVSVRPLELLLFFRESPPFHPPRARSSQTGASTREKDHVALLAANRGTVRLCGTTLTGKITTEFSGNLSRWRRIQGSRAHSSGKDRINLPSAAAPCPSPLAAFTRTRGYCHDPPLLLLSPGPPGATRL
jgi:hypothetical protein